jgi:hypothetical protein
MVYCYNVTMEAPTPDTLQYLTGYWKSDIHLPPQYWTGLYGIN